MYKGVTEWGRCGGVISGALPLGKWHTEICGNLFWIWCRHGGTCSRYSGYPHTDIMGNERAGQLAEEGRVRHWAYSREWVREAQRRQSSEWQTLGL